MCVSGGWNPTVHLHSQSGGRLTYRDDIASFVPGQAKQAAVSVGACDGQFGLAECLADGAKAGAAAARGLGFDPPTGVIDAARREERGAGARETMARAGLDPRQGQALRRHPG